MREDRYRDHWVLTRRRPLQAAGATVASCFLPAGRSFAANDLTGRLAAYMVASRGLRAGATWRPLARRPVVRQPRHGRAPKRG